MNPIRRSMLLAGSVILLMSAVIFLIIFIQHQMATSPTAAANEVRFDHLSEKSTIAGSTTSGERNSVGPGEALPLTRQAPSEYQVPAKHQSPASPKAAAAVAPALDKPESGPAFPANRAGAIQALPVLAGAAPAHPLDPAQARAAGEAAMRTGKHPELISPMFQEPMLTAAAWLKDPDAYLARVVPSRVFQSAQPGPGVEEIVTVSEPVLSLKRTAQATLQVRVSSGSPVSWNSIDSGLFTQSRLPAVTVRANDEGIAEATFTATPDCTGRVRILAASPFSSGRAEFILTVLE